MSVLRPYGTRLLSNVLKVCHQKFGPMYNFSRRGLRGWDLVNLVLEGPP